MNKRRRWKAKARRRRGALPRIGSYQLKYLGRRTFDGVEYDAYRLPRRFFGDVST